MTIYQSDPDAAPDSDFEPGSLRHLVVGNSGRLLDPRRTVVTIVGIHVETGFVTLRLDAFEDAGSTWDVPFEEIDRYQFLPAGERADAAAISQYQDAVERLARPLVIEADTAERRETEARIATEEVEANSWLDTGSRFLASRRRLPDPATRRGDRLLAADLEAFMRQRDLWAIEEAFSRQFVSNPYSGEIVKGHRVVLAECGLVPYAGTIIRDAETFDDAWSRERRLTHVCARLGFLRALFGRLGHRYLTLWRGFSTEGELERDHGRTFVSASFSEAVARSQFDSGSEHATSVLVRRAVPVSRVLMTYLETAAMNQVFLEAEAVLLAEPGDPTGLGV